jgi:predicted phosphodiesterase
MRLLLTSDLHYNHPGSRESAEQIIADINRAGCDVLAVIGDAAVPAGDSLEQCLGRFTHRGPKLFVPGNHELWTAGGDSYAMFSQELPARVRAMGWQWLQGEPFVADRVAIVGSIGWYDFSLAPPHLGIPLRFYQNKISPGAARAVSGFSHLFERTDDIPPAAMEVCARWNDGRYVHLGRSDEEFLKEVLGELESQLASVSKNNRSAPACRTGREADPTADPSAFLNPEPRTLNPVIAAIHHLPFAALLPPPRNAQWDFAHAFLGSEKIGRALLKYPAVRYVFCGHSHFAADVQVGHVRAVNIGSGYRQKFFRTIEV